MIHTCTCDNCDWKGNEEDVAKTLNEVHHLAERLDVGSIVPAGICPECDCFAYRDEPPSPLLIAAKNFLDQQTTATRSELRKAIQSST